MELKIAQGVINFQALGTTTDLDLADYYVPILKPTLGTLRWELIESTD